MLQKQSLKRAPNTLKTKTANGNWSVVSTSRLTMVNLCTSEILQLLILGVNLHLAGELWHVMTITPSIAVAGIVPVTYAMELGTFHLAPELTTHFKPTVRTWQTLSDSSLILLWNLANDGVILIILPGSKTLPDCSDPISGVKFNFQG